PVPRIESCAVGPRKGNRRAGQLPRILTPALLPSPALSPLRLRMCPKRLASSSPRVPVEEGSEALDQRTGSDLRSTPDLEGRSSSKPRPHLRHRPRCARRSPGRTAPYRQSQAAPAVALPLSKRWSSYTRNISSPEP